MDGLGRMKILILGAKGMLGHKLMQMLFPRHDILGTVRKSEEAQALSRRLGGLPIVGGIDTDAVESVSRLIDQFRPQALVNCVGIVKQLEAANDPIACITTNSLLPHRLARLCGEAGVRFVHISTDCVFSGNRGNYRETDIPDPVDLYGRAKLLGEVSGPGTLTLRTSLIGRELDTKNGLVEWFLSQRPKDIPGFRKVIYSGLTTWEFSRVVESVLVSGLGLQGVYHVSSDPINKYELLQAIKGSFGTAPRVVPSDQPEIDRSLDSTRFRQTMGYAPPTWPEMVNEMASDQASYGPLGIS
jgi:dTDP-4-dehydrorhamnose reductase